MSQKFLFHRRNARSLMSLFGILVLIVSSLGMLTHGAVSPVAAQELADDDDDAPVYTGAALTNNGILITFVEKTVNDDNSTNWVYEVEEMPGAQDLSNWVLETNGCTISSASPEPYKKVDPDPSSGIRGIKWQTEAGFSTGVFTMTVAQTATTGLVRVAAKAPDIAYGELTGPVCNGADDDDDGEIGTVIIIEESGFIVHEYIKIKLVLETGREIELKVKIKADKHGKCKTKFKINVKGKYKLVIKGEKSRKIVIKEYIVTTVTPEVAPEDTSNEPDYCEKGTFYIRFYNNEKLQGTPITVGCESKKLHFRWGFTIPFQGVQDDEFSAFWVNKVTFKKGRKKLRILVDDGVRISINGKTILSSWQLNPASIYERDFYIPIEGTYTVRVEYFEHHHVAAIQTYWCDDVNNCPSIYHPGVQNDYDPVVIPVGDIESDDAPDVYLPDDTRVKTLDAADWSTPASGSWTMDITDLQPTSISQVYLPVVQR